ncbi:unnamed protein product [Dibothriocephalus latus]|uniref:Uncharacterized protein n=1 Tax=Dibothriocephalus latus TaxID=60516 RepID=A0A3P7LWJ4_DIBLA|nr:unnamed protein product [Dibothriocephalus latus]
MPFRKHRSEPPLPTEQPLTRQALQLRIRIIEQFHLLCAIVGRWLLPLYGIGTAQLSELLLINIGTAADILDLFEAFNEEAVIKNVPLQVSILCLWQASVLQFCFNKTARLEISRPPTIAEHPQKPSSPDSDQHSPLQASAKEGANQNFCTISSTKKEIPPSSPMDETESQLQSPTDNVIRHSGSLHETESQDSKKEIPQSSSLHETESQEKGSESTDGGCFCGRFCRKSFIQDDQCRFVLFGTELWVIIMTLMLQDVPFMFLRLMLIFAFAVQSYQNIFFSVKNLIIIVAEVYRSLALLQTYGPNHKLMDWNHLFFRLR